METPVEIVCPNCHHELNQANGDGLHCTACGARFPKRNSLDVLLSEEEWKMASKLVHENTEAHKRYLPARRFPLAIKYYDWWAKKMWQKVPQSARAALELMCGGLELTRRMPPHIREALALDIDPAILEAAAPDLKKERPDRTRLVCGTAARLPLKRASVDAVLIMGGLHHIRPQISQVLAQVSRVLKPGGLLVASEPANDHWLTRMIRHWQYRHSPLQGHDEGEDGFTREEIRKVLSQNGLTLQTYETFGFIAYPLLGNMDLLPVLTRSRNERLGAWLIALDENLSKTPLLRKMAWASLFTASKSF